MELLQEPSEIVVHYHRLRKKPVFLITAVHKGDETNGKRWTSYWQPIAKACELDHASPVGAKFHRATSDSALHSVRTIARKLEVWERSATRAHNKTVCDHAKEVRTAYFNEREQAEDEQKKTVLVKGW
ncbi:MAG: hypothetical protein Q9166_007938 [cf. Caloplaca sp. 2 TL-2023]